MRIALFQPDIAGNVGAILRLAACLGAGVDLIEPMGFAWNDKARRRSAMDYESHVEVARHADWEAFAAKVPGRLVLFTTRGDTTLPAARFAPGDTLLFGSESAGAGTCTMDTLGDDSACRPCTPVRSCLNECADCEICVGRTAPDPSCGSGGTPSCPTGVASCGVDGERCGLGFYCITGCCVPEPVVR